MKYDSVIKKSLFSLVPILFISVLSGSASALFLYTLDLVTSFRINHSYIIYFLPIAGLLVGLAYHYFGDRANHGNNLLLDEFHSPKDIIPFRMAPMIYISTLIL